MTIIEHPWLCPPDDLSLPSEEVHVWRAKLDHALLRVQQLAKSLSDDERERAARFRFDRDRTRFIVSRGILRAILGRYLGIQPRQIRFRYSYHGKPYLSERFGIEKLMFNLTHSDWLALFAFSYNREVGIDLERIRPDCAHDLIVDQFFSSRERLLLRAQPANLRPRIFFTWWTRKEAYIKANGEGFSFSLNQFDVSLSPEEPAILLNVRGDPLEASRWSLREIVPDLGYIATLAAEGHDWQPNFWDWQE
jgi:4'-phosphopantetheinyl transferase